MRLFDGRSVRNSFSPTQTIRGDVRPWLDEQLANENRPYNLKHVLTPNPSRTLSITDEEQTLQELGIGPSANLVMVPIHSYSDAYGAAGPSLPVRGAYALYGLVSSTVGGLAGTVGSLFGYDQTPSPSVPTRGSPDTRTGYRSSDGARRPVSHGAHIRTLGDRNDNNQDDRQLYNGNQVCETILHLARSAQCPD